MEPEASEVVGHPALREGVAQELHHVIAKIAVGESSWQQAEHHEGG